MIHARADYDRFREPYDTILATLGTLEKATAEAAEHFDRVERENEALGGEHSPECWAAAGAAKGVRQIMALIQAAKAELRPAFSPIPADEPVMLFRAQDRHFVKLLAYYALLLTKDPLADPELVACIARHARRAHAWQAENPDRVKTPDVPKGALR